MIHYDSEEEEEEQIEEENTGSEDIEEEIDLEDVLPFDGKEEGFLQYQGNRVHKASIVRILFSLDPKSADRLRHVRGMSKHNSSALNGSTDEDDCLVVGDPCCTLLCAHETICLAIFLTESISNSLGTKVSSLAVSELSLGNVKVSGPIVVLKDTGCNGEWIWDQSLGSQVRAYGSFVQLINPDVLQLPDDSHKLTYCFHHDDLSVLCDALWNQARDNIGKLSSTTCSTVPNVNSAQQSSFVCSDKADSATIHTGMFSCKLCTKATKAPQMRLHIAFHIFNGDCSKYPCGFCGLACTCTIQLKKTSQHHSGPHSDCDYFYKLSLASAAKQTARSPCTNIPVQCTNCDQVHWKYNMATHFQDRHEPSSMPELFKVTPTEQSNVIKRGKFPKAAEATKTGGN